MSGPILETCPIIGDRGVPQDRIPQTSFYIEKRYIKVSLWYISFYDLLTTIHTACLTLFHTHGSHTGTQQENFFFPGCRAQQQPRPDTFRLTGLRLQWWYRNTGKAAVQLWEYTRGIYSYIQHQGSSFARRFALRHASRPRRGIAKKSRGFWFDFFFFFVFSLSLLLVRGVWRIYWWVNLYAAGQRTFGGAGIACDMLLWVFFRGVVNRSAWNSWAVEEIYTQVRRGPAVRRIIFFPQTCSLRERELLGFCLTSCIQFLCSSCLRIWDYEHRMFAWHS
jgi:hypothetical protein